MSQRGPDTLPDRDAVPATLRDRAQWVCWREQRRDGDDNPTKTPVDPATGAYASTTDPDTWASFDACREYAADEATAEVGVGVVFTKDDPVVGVDLDDCRIPATGTLSEEAREIVDRLDSYTEVSPSGTGLHVLLEGDLPAGRNRSGDVELYDDARYFTVTGAHLDGTPTTIESRQEALEAVYDAFVASADGADTAGDAAHAEATPESAQTADEPDGAVDVASLSDDDLLERARQAANGEKFRRLWRGDTGGYPSHSEADMALCSLLAFWTDGDAERVDRLFRQSGLMREKWDEQHYADGTTYGDKTVERAIRGTDEGYTPGGSADGSAAKQDPTPSDGPETPSAAASDSTAPLADDVDPSVDPPESVDTPVEDLPTADLSADTLETLVATIRELSAENARLREDLEQVRAERDRLADRVDERAADAPDRDEETGFWSLFSRSRSQSRSEPE